MLKNYTVLILFLLSHTLLAQYPVAPNEKDKDGKRIGRWTILYNKDFKPTDIKDSVKFYRIITYNKGIPSGKVYDYYLSGAIQSEMTLLSDEPTDVYDGQILIYYEKGNLNYKVYYNKGIPNGPYLEYYPNGRLKTNMTHLNGQIEGLLEYFHETGEKAEVYTYQNGKLNGPRLWYSASGTIIEKGLYVDGLKTDYWETWYESGTKDSEGNYIAGKKEGKWTFYHENKNIHSYGIFKNDLREGEWNYFHENGQKKCSGIKKNGLQEGKWIFNYSDGRLDVIYHYTKDTLNGLATIYYDSTEKVLKKGEFKNGNRHGPWEWYYKNGNIQTKLSYVNGILQGPREMYAENGTIVDKSTFKDDLKTGPYFQYYNDGKISQKGTLVDDKKNGTNEEYYPSGKLKLRTEHTLEQLNGLYEMYYENGQLRKSGKYINDTLTGVWEFFHENGKLQTKGSYRNGKREGFWEWYFDNGQLDGKGNFKNDLMVGYWEEFYPNGKSKIKGLRLDNSYKDGLWTFYFENGTIDKIGNYKNGDRIGAWKYFYQNGTVSCEGKMTNGEPQGLWVYYDSLGSKTMELEYNNGLVDGKKTIYKNNKIDTVYVYQGDKQITINTIQDSIHTELNKHRYKEAEALILEKKKMEFEKYAEHDVLRYYYLRNYSYLHSAKGEYELSEKYYKSFMELIKKYNGDTSTYYDAALNNLANIYSDQKRYDEAISLYNQSLKSCLKKSKLNDPNNFTTINNISSTYKLAGKIELAQSTLEKYRDEISSNFSETDSSYYLVLDNLALHYFNQRNYEKAKHTYRYLTTLLEKQKNTTKAQYRHALSNLANTYQQDNNYDSSLFYIKKAEQYYQAAKDTISDFYFYNLKKRSNYYIAIGKVDSAFVINSLIVEKMKDNPYLDYSIYKNALYAIAGYHYDKEQYDIALKLFLSLKERIENDDTKEDLVYGHSLQTIAYIYKQIFTNKNQEAATLFETSVQLKKKYYGEKSTDYLYAASDLARFYSLLQEYGKAISKGKEILGQIENFVGKNHYLYAHHSEVMGDIYNEQYSYKEALSYYQVSYNYYKSNKENYYSDYIDLSTDLANCLENLYKEEEAEKLYLTTLEEIERKTGKENVKYLNVTRHLIDLYLFLDKNQSAKIYLKEAILISKSISGEKSDYYFSFLNRLSKAELNLGEYIKSDSVLSQMKKVTIENNGSNSSNYLTYLKQKANLEHKRGNYRDADVFYILSLKLAARLYGTNSEDYAILLKKRGVFYRDTKNYTESIEFLEKSKKAIEQIYGNKSLNYAYVVEELAKTSDYKSEYSKSENYYDIAIPIYEKEVSRKSWSYLNAQRNKGDMYVNAGLYSKAKTTYELYMKDIESYVGKEANYALALSKIASIFRRSNSFKKAIDYQKESQQILVSEYSIEDWRSINSLNEMGLIYLDANQLDSASYYFDSYLKLIKKLYPSDSVAQSYYYNNYALVCHKKGKFDEAEKHLNTALRLNKSFKISTTSDPTYYVNFYDNYAQLYTSWQKYDKAEKYWEDVLPRVLTYTNKMFGSFSEQEKTQFWSEYSKDFEIYNSYCLQHQKIKPEVLQKMYNNRIATKAIVLNSINKLKKRIYSSRDTILIKKYENWLVLKDQTARYYGVSAKQLKEADISLDSMERVIEKLEKELNISAEDNKEKSTTASWSDIQKKLLPGEAAIEIIRFRNFTNYLTDSIVYAALILTANTKENPELVILPYGNKLETRFLTFYKNAIKFKTTDTLSYKAFWEPLEGKLKNINTLYISLDGAYNQFNINTLMLPDGSYLLDKRKIIIVSNTKDVITLKTVSNLSENKSSQGVHLFGFPDYDAGMDKLPTNIGTERDLNLDFASKNSITKLPGTKVEMEKIVVLLADKQWRFRSYLNEQATEDYVKQLQSPLVLHIATHGFFLGEEQVKLGAENTGYLSGQKYNPLLMSGLMLTGATKSLLGYASHDAENGILTALEASTLSLDNTELVILSACETGKGEIKVGEGVYGLQRAFQVAGAKATIMSLWKVDDNATQQLMESFYRYWIESGNKTEAFRKAQLELKQKHASPYYWGAFVMMGQ